MADSISASPQQPVLGAIARALKFREQTQQGLNSPTGALLDLILPTSQTVEKWSYGDPLFRTAPQGTGSRIPMTVRDKEYVAETLGYAPIGVPAKAAATGVMMTPPIGAIKPKGGNWITGQVERAVAPIKADYPEPLSDLEKVWAERGLTDTPGAATIRAERVPAEAINKWLDSKLTKYIKNEMATPEDPLRALAERGVLHFNPPEINSFQRGQLGITRSALGYPSESTALSDLARKWEDLTDYYVQRSDAGSVVRPNYFLRPEDAQRVYAENPWLFKVPPETSVYSLNRGLSQNETGFRHLVDELRAATDPNSELPANLRLSVDKLDKVTVPQAVELVSKINAWRAEQAAAAEKAGMLANLQTGARLQDDSLQLSFVDKPGGKWIDLPEATEGKNVDFCTTIGKQGGWCTMNKATAKSYGSGNNRLIALVDAEGRPHLQAMISRGISSDPRGDIELIQSVLTETEFRKLNRFMESDDFTGETQDAVDWMAQNMPRAYAKYQKQLQNEPLNITELKPPENSFSSKRAKEYASRDPEYQDKITDAALNFLNSGQWGDVKDLGIYNIVDIQNPDSVIDELRKIYKLDYRALPKTDSFYAAVDADPYAPRFMKRSDFEKFIQPFESVNPEPKSHGGAVGMAAGGAVMMDEGGPAEYDPKKVDQIADSFFKKFISLDTPQEMTAAETAADIAAGFVPGLGTAQAARDLERARREGDKLGMALSAVGMVPFVGGAVKPGKIAVKSLGELVDQYVRKVRKMEELGPSGYSAHKVEAPASAEIPGWHISQDLPGILTTGAMTNKAVGASNIQGWAPAHIGGAYFYSDPRIARAKWEDLAETIGDPALAAEMPIIRAQLRRGNRLVPDEDVSLSVPWQRSYQEGSFATKRPVLINQIDRIYSADPNITKDLIRDTVIRQRRYATGGAVSADDYNEGKIQALADSILEELHG